jgi:hypothetical protein
VVPEASLFTDLDAESFDIVEMICRLEEEFDVRLEVEALFPEAMAQQQGAAPSTPLTAEQRAELSRSLPFLELPAEGGCAGDVRRAYTVAALARFVEGLQGS